MTFREFLRHASLRLGAFARDGVRMVHGWPLWKKAAAVIAVCAFVAVVWLFDIPSLATLRVWADSLGWWFAVAFWCAYVVIAQFPIPRTMLSITAGILFGPILGLALAITATAVAASVSLSIMRGFLKEWIRPRLTHPAVEKINRHLQESGWIAVISLRLIPAIPFSVMNYVASVTDVRVGVFTLGTLIGSLPGTTLIVLFGDTLTGTADPWIIALMVVLAALGLCGVVFDTRNAVKA